MSEFHFRLHFLAISDRYATLIVFKMFDKIKMADVSHLDFLNSLSIAILAISDHRRPFWMSENHFGLHFWPFHFGCPKFGSIWSFIIFFKVFDKMVAGGHFGCPQITFDCVSGHLRSIRNFFLIVSQNGRRRPFWMGRQLKNV